MRANTRLAFLLGMAATTLGCQSSLRVRIDEPAGSTLTILERSDPVHEREDSIPLELPFVAELDAAGGRFGYPVSLTMPESVASRYGGAGDVRLFGQLYVYPPTRVSGQTGVVTLRIPEERLTSLLRGEVAVIETFVVDPNEGRDRYLVRLTLRSSVN